MSDPKATDLSGLSYDPNEAKYWDKDALSHEVDRVFDLCHGCRLCFNLCPSFPALFDDVDKNDGDVTKLTQAESKRVFDLCYGCKVCYVKCPYTPTENHEWQLDFPRLVHRARAVEAKEKGGPDFRDKLLANPDGLGGFAKLAPKLANWANKTSFHRSLMQSFLGIHKDKQLPDFASETFSSWVEKNPPKAIDTPTEKVALFYTCFVNHNNPSPGKAAVSVLETNNCSVTCPKQNCCGMPALDAGDVDFAKRQAQSNVDSFLPLVRSGHKIVGINPTCSLMIRQDYPTLLGTPEAREVANATVDTHELLFALKKEKKFVRDFRSTPKKVAYHVPCHLRAQNIGYRSRDILRLIPDTEVSVVAECCAHDGTWAMKKENFELSMKYGDKAFEGMKAPKADIMATDCPLAAIQFEQATGTRPMHPVEVLERAYRPDGFDTVIQKQEDNE